MGEAATPPAPSPAPTAARFGDDEEYATTETSGLGAASTTPLNAGGGGGGGITTAPATDEEVGIDGTGATGMTPGDDAVAARSEEGGGKARGETSSGW